MESRVRRGENLREAGPTAVDSNCSGEMQQDVVESAPSLMIEPGGDPGNLCAGVAIPAFDAVVPASQLHGTENREELLDALEFDLTRLDSDEDTFAAVPGNRVGSVDEGFGAARAGEAQRTPRRLRLVGTQPTHVDSSSGNRFSPLRDDDDDSETDVSDSDESESLSVVDPEFVGDEVRAEPELQVDRVHNFHAAFHSLEGVDVRSMFETRAHVMKTVPGCMHGVLRGAFRLDNRERESTGAWLETVLLGPQDVVVPSAEGWHSVPQKVSRSSGPLQQGILGRNDQQRARSGKWGQGHPGAEEPKRPFVLRTIEPPVLRSWRWQAS